MKRRISFSRILNFIFLISLMWGGVFLSCKDIISSNNNSENEVTSPSDDNSKPNNTAETKDSVWNDTKEFDTWNTNVFISAEKFSTVAEGSQLIFSLDEIASAEYHNMKIYNSSWTPLSSGDISGATLGSGNDAAAFVPTSNTVTYTLTASDATALKSSGLYINGYGVTLKKVEVVAKGTSSGGTTETPTIPETPATPDVTPNPPPVAQTGTPFKNHGKLHVSGAYLCDEHDQKYQLYGMSTHGINFGTEFSRYVNNEAFKTLRDEWNTNCVRLVLYPRDSGGYCNGGNKAELKQLVCDGIEYATELGMYVLVDWHVHAYNPQDTQTEAIAFLGEISARYKNYGNVLYEICNEPTGSPWNTAIKPYAQAVIPAIRKNAPNAVIIVGTNNWSQDLEEAWKEKLEVPNVMYTFHFYADTHKDSMRARVETVIKSGMPVFITEFGTCDASGNGGFNAAESESWFTLMKKYNISHMNWSLCNKNETASAILENCTKTSGWAESDLTESGKLIRNHFISLTR